MSSLVRFLACLVWILAICSPMSISLGQVTTTAEENVSQASYEQTASTESEWLLGEDPFQFEQGNPNAVVDGIGWVTGIPEKLLLWNSEVINHSVSDETQRELAEYIRDNKLDTVKVRVNQYAPLSEWKRLRENKQVSAGWRYSVGALVTLGYTLFPGRLFGSDSYNPYTNTINVYSDVPALALEQAAYAKDVQSRENPGNYATGQLLPIWSLNHEYQSKQEVYDYLAKRGNSEQQAAAQKVLQPQLGMEVGGGVGALAQPLQPVFQIAGAGLGHVTGYRKAKQISANEAETR